MFPGFGPWVPSPPARVIDDSDPSTWPNCTKCKRKPNKYLTEDFVCWECQNVWPNEEAQTNSNAQPMQIRQTDDDNGPPTWPLWWKVTPYAQDAAWCQRHLELFHISGYCNKCKAAGLI